MLRLSAFGINTTFFKDATIMAMDKKMSWKYGKIYKEKKSLLKSAAKNKIFRVYLKSGKEEIIQIIMNRPDHENGYIKLRPP